MRSLKNADCEKSAKGSRAHLKQKRSQLQPNDAAFSVVNFQAREQPPLQRTNALFSVGMKPQWQPKKAAFSIGSNKEHKKGINQLDKRTRSGFDEECKKFGRMFREKLQEFAMILSKKYHYNFPVEYFDDYHGSFNKEEFLGAEQPKEETRLRTSNSLPTPDFGQKKKHSDRAADQKEPSDLFEEEIISQDAPTKRLQGNIRETIDEVIEEAKANSLPPVASAGAEGFGTAPDKKLVENGTTLDQTNQTKGPAIGVDDGAEAFPQILDLSKSEEQSHLKQNIDLTWVKIGNEKVKTARARGKLRDIAEGIEGFAEENKTIAVVLVFAPTRKSKLLSTVWKDESLAEMEVAAAPNANAHKQLWYEYPRQICNPPLLQFQDVAGSFVVEYGSGMDGNEITEAKNTCLPYLLVWDGDELSKEVKDTVNSSFRLQVSTVNHIRSSVADHVLQWKAEFDWTTIEGGGCIGLEFDKVSSMEVLGQLRPEIDLRHLRTRKKRRPRRRKKERKINQIEKAGIG